MIHRILMVAAVCLGFQCERECLAAAVLTFELGTPTVTGSIGSFDVNLSFQGDPGDRLESIQLSVLGSDSLLTAGGSDFSRFAFSLDSANPLNSWSALGTLAVSGVELLFADIPILGPFVEPDPNPRRLGELTVDLSGIAAGTDLVVTLAGGPPGLDTDAGGILGGLPVFSAATDPDTVLGFANPGGVTIAAPGGVAAVPEPTALAIWGFVAFGALLSRLAPCRMRASFAAH